MVEALKIGILVTISNLGFGKKGFYQSQEVGLAKMLIKMGHEVSVYKSISSSEEMSVEVLQDKSIIYRIPTKAIGVHGMFPAEHIEKDLDCLFCFADTQIFLPHIIKYCKKNGILFIPYVGIGHSAQKNAKSILMDTIFRLGTLREYKKMTVLVKTPMVAEEFSKLGVKDVKVVPVGMDMTALKDNYEKEDRDKLRELHEIQKSDIVISFIGRLQPEKRPLDFVDIFNEIKEKDPSHHYRALVIGKGPLKEDMLKKVSALGLEDDFEYHEQVPYEEMWKMHYISDFNVNLCDREIFGMALSEAVYYQSSCAALHAPGPDLILKNMKGHCLCENNDDVVNWILHGKPSDSVLKENSKMLVDGFSWKTCADEIVSMTKKYKKGSAVDVIERSM